jgi:hypothetical protein
MSVRFAIAAFGLAAHGALADGPPRYVRDWQVERPVVAGLVNGLTVGVVPSTRFGSGGAAASPSDPYGVSGTVHAEVARLSEPAYRVATAVGLVFWVFCAAGVVHRYRSLARARALEARHVA